ncbi:MAG: HNH endonuclease [Alkalispirochaeta sp.]
MKGTKHFPRLSYNVSRGLREIVAPVQTMSEEDWNSVLRQFDSCCAFCGEGATRENRGIVPDHLVPVTDYGELMLGNVVPACQRCNDSRGNGDWRKYVVEEFPEKASQRIATIEAYLSAHPYKPFHPEEILNQDELREYNEILAKWESIQETAKDLYDKVKTRRGIRQTG